jgi:hypothetical protein
LLAPHTADFILDGLYGQGQEKPMIREDIVGLSGERIIRLTPIGHEKIDVVDILRNPCAEIPLSVTGRTTLDIVTVKLVGGQVFFVSRGSTHRLERNDAQKWYADPLSVTLETGSVVLTQEGAGYSTKDAREIYSKLITDYGAEPIV